MSAALLVSAVTLLGLAGGSFALHLAVRGALGLPLLHPLTRHRLRMIARILGCLALALVVLPFFLLFGEDRVEEYDPAYDLD